MCRSSRGASHGLARPSLCLRSVSGTVPGTERGNMIARKSLYAAGKEGVMTPRLEIEYCTRCRWLLRAAWLAQELLTTFETELGEVTLIPGSNGVFEVRLDSNTLFSRRREGRFPESKELKQLVRDRIAPHKPLGHSER